MYPRSKDFLCNSASAANAAGVNPNGSKTLLANTFSIFLIKVKSIFSNDLRGLSRNPTDYTVLGSWFFNNFVLFARALRT